ncbi:M28 family peptidase [Paraflavitalea sp. CAU 1676]|uniref:M28 family peptidase n=1 Tax=Paraflavitalea sp. CAU 1676 TaxID=3032598 RepID=UPI0023DA7EAE|nr:M28 family peptidase [Paraflavitalea sp. CAU 1676]MDF2189987.1 M28 family peptidase [Paraflavitalea sp. CAU 1676]
MRKLCLAMALAAPLGMMAQKIANPVPYANSISAEELKKHLYIVAGPEMEGRETATEGQRKAAAYIENYFKQLGLAPGYNGAWQQPYPVYQDSLVSASIEINGKKFQPFTDFYANLSSSNSSSFMTSEVVFVGYGISDSTRNDYKGIDARGKVVLVLAGTPPSTQAAGAPRRGFGMSPIMEAASKNGAIAVLQVQVGFPRRNASNRGSQYISGFRKTIYPNLYGISDQVAEAIMGADYATAKDAMKAGNPQAKTYAANIAVEFNKAVTKLESSNVIGFLEGSDKKDEYVFLTAHYDHIGKTAAGVINFGADDDGSGTVSILELAEAFVKAKAAGKGPRRSIVFMTVSGEEKGLWGSEYYSDHPVYPLDKTTVDLNIDMIGRIDPKRKIGDSTNYIFVVGDDKLSSDLRPISEAMNKKYTKMELDYKFNEPNDPERIYYRSDHFNFARKGVPIIFYFNGTHADYHRPTDTPDKINYDLMAKRAKLVFFTAWEMANRNDMLKRDIPLTMPGR